MCEEREMTKPVVVKQSGKVVGIRGLYRAPTTGRLYVRYSYHGKEKQRTVFPKNQTFSELEKTALKTFSELKKEVQAEFVSKPRPRILTKKQLVSIGIKRLAALVQERWALRGCTYAHIHRLLKSCEKLAICESKRQKDIEIIEEYNKEQVNELLNGEGITPYMKFNNYTNVSNVFMAMIQDGFHHGKNPAMYFAKVRTPMNRKKCNFNFEVAAEILRLIEKIDHRLVKEFVLFFRLCVETGQRPIDVYFFDMRKIEDKHYYFLSHKTKREQRVSHRLSDDVLSLVEEIVSERECEFYKHVLKNRLGNDEHLESFWTLGVDTYSGMINRIFKEHHPEATLYQARHFFVSEIFRMTDSDFWAEVFTHEGHTANTRHYLHIDQDKADEILIRFCDSFKSTLESLSSS